MARSQKRSIALMSWVTKRIVRPPRLSRWNSSKHFCWKRGVADREHLVDQQDLGVDLDRHREREAHVHPRGVVLQPHVEELLELGEGDDVVEARTRLLAA